MKRNQRLNKIYASVAASALLFSFCSTAIATERETSSDREYLSTSLVSENNTDTLSESDKDSIRQELLNIDVKSQVADSLIEKLSQGQPWESLKPDSQPVSISRSTDGSVIKTTETYSDGSVTVSTISDLSAAQKQSSSTPSLRSVSGCTFSSGGAYGGYWRNCLADVNLVLIRMGFTFDYESIRDMGSKITSYGNYFHHVLGASLSNFRFNRISNRQVRLSADLDFAFQGFPAGWTAWMQANVNGSEAWTTHN